MNFSSLFPWILTSLNCRDITELSNQPWAPWTEAELYNYADEAIQDIGARFLLNVQVGSTGAIVGQGDYAISPISPAHIATIYVAYGGRMLRPSTVAEMEALDDNWRTAAPGTPSRWVGNVLGLSTIAIYPPAAVFGLITVFYQREPDEITPASTSVDMPAPVGDYLAMRLLEQARLRQGEMEMPDVAEALGSVAKVYEGALEAYYGKGAT